MLIRNYLNMFVNLRSPCSFTGVIKTEAVNSVHCYVGGYQILTVQFCFLVLKQPCYNQQVISKHWKLVKNHRVIFRQSLNENSLSKRSHKAILLVILICGIRFVDCELFYYHFNLKILRRNLSLFIVNARLNC